MKYAGQVKFSLIGSHYFFFMHVDVYDQVKHLVEYVDEVEMRKVERIHLAEIESLEKKEEDDDDLFPEEKKTREDSQRNSGSKMKMIKCRVKDDYFDVTKLLINSNIPIIQEYDFLDDK
jgi:hypothetical protein